MNIKSKFNLGQKVWPIGQDRIREWQTCSACNGYGQVKLMDQKLRNCPECSGNMGRYIYKELSWQVGGMMTVGQIRIEITNAEKDKGQMFDNICHFKDGITTRKEQYMMYETGIRSGTLWDGDKLFPSCIEAEEECDHRNETAKTLEKLANERTNTL